MNLTLKQSGLSARRKTNNFSTRFSSITLWGTLIVIFLLLSSCHEKTSGQNPEEQKNTTSITKDSLHKPKVNIKVNKHYDEQGNVIGFDSAYTSFYSTLQGDTSRMDSLMNSFKRYFKHGHPSFFQNEFNTLFFKDSLHDPDFFHDDFFLKRYELNDRYFRDMMNRMDSIKNHFYYDHRTKEKEKNSKDL